jgi:GAF domain-containing protein
VNVSPNDRRKPSQSSSQSSSQLPTQSPSQSSIAIGGDASAAAWRTDVLAGPPSERLDRMTQTVAAQFKVPMAAISLIDDKRHVAISTHGLPRGEEVRNFSPCSLVVDSGLPLNVADASADPRYAGFPLVAGPLKVRGYLGVPLRTDDDVVLGTLCLLDRRRREFTREEQQTLVRFGKLAEHLLRSR